MKRVAAILALAVLAVLAGCGGGGGPSKADYIAKADKICRAARTDALPMIRQMTAGGTSPGAAQARQLAGVTAKLHATEARYLGRLRALDRPSGDSDAIEKFLAPATQVVDAIDSASSALRGGDVATALSLLGRAQFAAAEAKNAADAYGFKACGGALALAV